MHKIHRPARAAFVSFFAAALFLAGSAMVLAQGQDTTINGRLAYLSGTTLMLELPDGSLKTVNLLANTLVLAREPAALDSIKPGDALGVAARRGMDGSLTADDINIFSPELWNVVRKGQWPMQSGDVMTNAQVTSYAMGVQGRTLTMKYRDVVANIQVPDNARIDRLITEKVADLKDGMRLYIRGTMSPEGSIAAGSITYNLPGRA
jgi:hypothetical protein